VLRRKILQPTRKDQVFKLLLANVVLVQTLPVRLLVWAAAQQQQQLLLLPTPLI
jgi:hypothetical protein